MQQAVEGVNIQVNKLRMGTSSEADGSFQLTVPANLELVIRFQHVNYKTKEIKLNLDPDQEKEINLILEEDIKTLQQVEIQGRKTDEIRPQTSITRIDPKTVQVLPTPFAEFNKILVTLPGVVSNNELSSTYSVRGGNFDENLVYVNDIPIYRPFLIRAGQQEGLSFVNPDLVEQIAFSSGGWQPKYGDKLASNLNITYRKPEKFDGALTFGLLGGNGFLQGVTARERLSYLVGVRHKRSTYLLNTLETQGEYLPNYTDLQTYLNLDLSGNKAGSNPADLDLLFSYSRNRFLVEPENRETTFGNIFDGVIRLFVAFDGRELMEYDTYQGGARLTKIFSPQLKNSLIISGMQSREREYFDIEGGYRLCDVNKDFGSEDFDRCIGLRGIGTNYRYARNRLIANIATAENRIEFLPEEKHKFEFGLGYILQDIKDDLDEYSFLDSADFVQIDENIDVQNRLTHHQITSYAQHSWQIDPYQLLTYGVRLNFYSLNQQLLISPRMQYSYQPAWNRDVLFKASLGVYQQPPLYRELRDFSGNLNLELRAQSSVHAILGLDYNLQIWNRPFKLLAETYYKYLYNIVPYDVDNVRIRYFAQNNAKAFATGLDLRLSGEFIPGTESWFSLGLLSTREDVENDGRAYIRRPSDQRLTLGIFFEDHLPNDPTTRMNLNLVVGSGLPFGPPQNVRLRNIFVSEMYRRVDIGFRKLISLKKIFPGNRNHLNSLWIGLEILNLLGADNTISYTWIKDLSNTQYGIPNSLSARFLNVKLTVK